MPKRIRRAWTIDQKRAIVAEANEPGAIKKVVAAKHEIGEGLIYQWKNELDALSGAQQADTIVTDALQSLKKEKRLRLKAIEAGKAFINQCDQEIAQWQEKRDRIEKKLKLLLAGILEDPD